MKRWKWHDVDQPVTFVQKMTPVTAVIPINAMKRVGAKQMMLIK